MIIRKRSAGSRQKRMGVVLGFVLSLGFLIPVQAQNGAARSVRPVSERPQILRLARHQSKSPLQWYAVDLRIWLIQHPSPNSDCDGDHFAEISTPVWSEACNWRIETLL